MQSKLRQLLYRVKRNEIAMIEKRKYDISKEEMILNFSFPEFNMYYNELIQEQGGNIYDHLNETYTNAKGEKIYVFYPAVKEGFVGNDIIAEFINTLAEMGIKKAVIISPKGLSTYASTTISHLPLYFIQSFTYTELSWNKTQHILVDDHELLTEEELESFLKKNSNISLEKLPVIVDTDPQAKYLGAISGQVIKINRTTIFYPSYVNKSVNYRLVKPYDEVMRT